MLEAALPTTRFQFHQPGPALDAVRATARRRDLPDRFGILRSGLAIPGRLAAARPRVEGRPL